MSSQQASGVEEIVAKLEHLSAIVAKSMHEDDFNRAAFYNTMQEAIAAVRQLVGKLDDSYGNAARLLSERDAAREELAEKEEQRHYCATQAEKLFNERRELRAELAAERQKCERLVKALKAIEEGMSGTADAGGYVRMQQVAAAALRGG